MLGSFSDENFSDENFSLGVRFEVSSSRIGASIDYGVSLSKM